MTPTECLDAVRQLVRAGDMDSLLGAKLRLVLEGDPPSAAASVAPPPTAATATPVHVACVYSDDPRGRPVTSSAPHSGRAFFQHPPGNVTLLADRLYGGGDVRATLRHEVQHALDLLGHGMDLASCGGLACSEVRAASIAECAQLHARARRRACVAETATKATLMVFPEAGGVGASCVRAVLPLCFESHPQEDPTRSDAYRALLAAEADGAAAPAQGLGGDRDAVR